MMHGMEPTRILAIRHGETAWNVDTRIQGHLDIPLNATGREQASRLARALLGHAPIDAICSSDLSRALQTARIVADATGAPLSVNAGLPELVGGVAYLDFLTADDDLETGLEGDLAGFQKRTAAWYRRKLRATGLVACGLGIWAAQDLAPALTALERAE